MSKLAAPPLSATSRPREAAARRETGAFSLLHTDPVVLAAPDWELRDPAAAAWSVLEAIRGRRSYLVLQNSFSLVEGLGEDRASFIRGIARRYDHSRVVMCCPTPEEAAAAERQGIAALYCSPAALIREDLFTPTPGRVPIFDAIYDARWANYKRHDLAGCVRSLALIAAPAARPTECTADYFRRAHAAMSHASWITSPWGSGKRWLSSNEVNAAYNLARVGLCLSRKEGHMYASIQYLMAGLPVVTTRSLGGRDEFFDPEYVRWVDDDPEAVANAVDELVALEPDPEMIRAATLAKVRQHRARLQGWIREVIEKAGGEPGRWGGEWPGDLPNKLNEPRAHATEVIAEIERVRSTSATTRSGRQGLGAERRQTGQFSLLHADPVVLYALDSELGTGAALWSVLEALPERASYLIVSPSWSLLDPGTREARVAQIRQVAQRFEQVVTVTICPTLSEEVAVRCEGLATLHCSEGALVREDIFTPAPGREPIFDAIYDARWSDYKRHDLAGGVRSLALIAPPPWRPETKCTVDYFRRAQSAVRNATWISTPWGSANKRWLSGEEVNAAYNQARVGLCLSRIEGHMSASIQYLMAGLPVVTTANLGGRDEFFDPAYVRWVDDDATAVASAVEELVSLDLDPQMIRDATLAKVKPHRARLQAWIQEVIRAEGGKAGRWAGGWPEGLPNKLRDPWARAADVTAEIGARRSAA